MRRADKIHSLNGLIQFCFPFASLQARTKLFEAMIITISSAVAVSIDAVIAAGHSLHFKISVSGKGFFH
ncbi:hypothetical protein A7Q09_02010 [Methylacidiphilum sp. Yel]|nr:hypothetical protein A7Q09_02010 [Methylacidiphilum sp. Yel]